MVNDIVKKILIIGLGLIIATYVLVEYFEHKPVIKEGMTAEVAMLGTTLATTPSFVSNAATAATHLATTISGQAIGAGQRFGLFGAKVGQDVGIAATEAAHRTTNKGIDTAEKTQIAVSAEISRKTTDINTQVRDSIKAVSDKMAQVKTAMYQSLDTIRNIYQENKTTLYRIWQIGFVLTVLALFGFLKKVFLWAIDTVACLIKRFQNFKSCFFWYLLEIIGQILYLPIRLIVWMGGKTFSKYEKKFWKFVYDVDCKIYDIGGFHVFHFPESVQQKCYDCRFKPFPNIIAHFEEVKKNKDVMGTFRSIIGF